MSSGTRDVRAFGCQTRGIGAGVVDQGDFSNPANEKEKKNTGYENKTAVGATLLTETGLFVDSFLFAVTSVIPVRRTVSPAAVLRDPNRPSNPVLLFQSRVNELYIVLRAAPFFLPPPPVTFHVLPFNGHTYAHAEPDWRDDVTLAAAPPVWRTNVHRYSAGFTPVFYANVLYSGLPVCKCGRDSRYGHVKIVRFKKGRRDL